MPSIQVSILRLRAEWRVDAEGQTENTQRRRKDTHLEEQIENNRNHPVGPEMPLKVSKLGAPLASRGSSRISLLSLSGRRNIN